MLNTQMTRAEERRQSRAVGRRPHRPVRARPVNAGRGQRGLHSARNNEPLKVSEKADEIRALI